MTRASKLVGIILAGALVLGLGLVSEATPHVVEQVDAVCRYEDAVPTAMRCWDTDTAKEFLVHFQVKDGVKL